MTSPRLLFASFVTAAITGCSGAPFEGEAESVATANTAGAPESAPAGNTPAAPAGRATPLPSATGAARAPNPEESAAEEPSMSPTTGGTGGQPSLPAVAGGAGASGAAQEAGSGGTASAGVSGTGGGTETGAVTEPRCKSGSSPAWKLEYYPDVVDEFAQEIRLHFRISQSSESVALERISLRYYFTSEVSAAETGSCYFLSGNRCDAVAFDFQPLAKPTPTATRYLQLSFASGTGLFITTLPSEFAVGFNANYAVLRQSNDYSFDSAASAPTSKAPSPFVSWEHITLYVDGTLVWGSEPCG